MEDVKPMGKTMIPKNRAPATPGEILRAEFLEPLGMTQGALAKRMGVGEQTVNLLVNGKRGMTPENAVRLSRIFETTPHFWMNLQSAVDLWKVERAMESKDAR